jgi:hypothetical protein
MPSESSRRRYRRNSERRVRSLDEYEFTECSRARVFHDRKLRGLYEVDRSCPGKSGGRSFADKSASRIEPRRTDPEHSETDVYVSSVQP